ncbi:MAG: flagellar basal-body rod protein FlgC [Frankiales bacterium]|nr:flagellar basal-body rod protein FlgC [Frankiales bacterium]
MSTFGSLDISRSALTANRQWMDAVSDNLANMNDVSRTTDSAFRARYIVAQAAQTGDPGGVEVVGAVFGSAAGRLVSQPGHPLADANGMVRVPDIDMGDQMVQLMMAQRAYQANLSVVDRAKDAYQAALGLGR